MAKILVVDDDTAILEMIGTILNKDGHFVTKVSNPFEINMEKVNLYDLILLDIMMPGLDGFVLCSKIRKFVDCPILFLTAKTEESSLVKGLSLGADDYICKPFGVKELRARVAAHHAAGHCHTPARSAPRPRGRHPDSHLPLRAPWRTRCVAASPPAPPALYPLNACIRSLSHEPPRGIFVCSA